MTTKENHPILVPYDFTSVSDVAIIHAASIAKLTGYPLIILNIVDESTQKFLKQHNQIEKFLNINLEKICEKTRKNFHVKVSFLIKKGSIISIRNIAENLHISYMFIGIDQPHTLASQVLRMIGNSPAPVYVVQGNIKWKDINTIVFPVDSYEETRQKISCTIIIAKYTNATVRLFSIKLRNKERQYTQDVRVRQIEKMLLEKEIPFVTDYATRDEKEFPDELPEYATTNNADLFILMKTPTLYFNNLFINPIDKKVLLNSQNIPSIYINPRDVGRYI
ncbi:MAG: universal stress protein [Bacteroidales bacterium]